MRKVKIVSHGSYLPKRVVPAEELDTMMGLPKGTVRAKSNIATHYYADIKSGETQSQMAAFAVMDALEKMNLKIDDIDAIISASGSKEQHIPSTASLILKALHANGKGIHAFDVDSTCVSFITALDTISYMVDAGRFDRVVIVSSEIASVGLDYNHIESCSLFSDGAVCMVLERTPGNEPSKIISGDLKIYPEGAHYCQVRGGGTLYHPKLVTGDYKKYGRFEMDGKALFKIASRLVPEFLHQFIKNSKMTLDDVKLLVPHQASSNGLNIIQRKMKIPDAQWMNIIRDYGNMIAASIPFALSKSIEQKRIERGDKVILFGTSAGFGLGALALEY